MAVEEAQCSVQGEVLEDYPQVPGNSANQNRHPAGCNLDSLGALHIPEAVRNQGPVERKDWGSADIQVAGPVPDPETADS